MDAIVPIGPLVYLMCGIFVLYLFVRFYGGGTTNPTTYRNCRNIAIITGLLLIVYSIFLGLGIHQDPDSPGVYFSYNPIILLSAWPVFIVLFLMFLDLFSQYQQTINPLSD